VAVTLCVFKTSAFLAVYRKNGDTNSSCYWIRVFSWNAHLKPVRSRCLFLTRFYAHLIKPVWQTIHGRSSQQSENLYWLGFQRSGINHIAVSKL
jgi:hypothetical protein